MPPEMVMQQWDSRPQMVEMVIGNKLDWAAEMEAAEVGRRTRWC